MKKLIKRTLGTTLPLLLSLSFFTACQNPLATGGNDSVSNTINSTASKCTSCSPGRGKIVGQVTSDGLSTKSFNVKQSASASVEIRATVKVSSALETKEVTTDASGKFEIDVKAGADYTVEATMPDGKGGSKKFPPATVKVPLAEDPQIIDIKSLVTRSTGAIQGLIKIEGADAEEAEGVDVFIAGTSIVGKAHGLGRFTLSEVPEGTWNVVFQKYGFEKKVIKKINVKPGKTTMVKGKVVMSKINDVPRGVSGTVLDSSGNAILGASVTAYPKNGGGSNQGNYIGTTNDEGKFEILFLPKGEYTIQVYRPFYGVPDRTTINVDGDDVKDLGTINLKSSLAYFGKISGQIVDEKGEPIDGALAQTEPQVGDQMFTDANGDFQLERIYAGEYNVSFSAGGYCTVIKPLRVENVPNFNLEMEKPIVLKAGDEDECTSVVDKPAEEVAVESLDISLTAEASAEISGSGGTASAEASAEAKVGDETAKEEAKDEL